ncbi:hypothetical protein G6L86_20625 [Agrobacterium tumefaciens]|uniref:hypothetical protein n=1 Tax=Agrobacterium tumefaciens TaxID=358 RepID=UPI0015720C41|nr:hypothetical protein [Agrobacterium tumefaciens]NSX88017.1 hypothetical protein [Agrobacterium tumefaciens]
MIAAWLWPSVEVDDSHVHTDLEASHPHIAGAAVAATGGYRHSHAFVKDRHHRH